MKFNEWTHTFIPARFYVRLTEAWGERGRKAFVQGTQRYAEQRGRRMAQRAVRDGRELTFETYLEYGEWVNTAFSIEKEVANVDEVISCSPHYVKKITRCAWHSRFKDMGLTEAGHEYCNHLDIGICRGFNPYLGFDVEKTLHKSDCCIHIMKEANFPEGAAFQKKMEYVQPFEYHCGHSYWCYQEVTAAIFGAAGEQIGAKVMEDFAQEYGPEMADKLAAYRYENFDVAK